MSDKALLELAAKAAGMDGLGLFWNDRLKCLWDAEGLTFDPLTDDSDALRLAVKLKLIVDIGCGYAEARDPEYDPEPIKAMEYLNDHTDPYAATRRAIVRAAAEIGRGME